MEGEELFGEDWKCFIEAAYKARPAVGTRSHAEHSYSIQGQPVRFFSRAGRIMGLQSIVPALGMGPKTETFFSRTKQDELGGKS